VCGFVVDDTIVLFKIVSLLKKGIVILPFGLLTVEVIEEFVIEEIPVRLADG
jgi:hypothetical protein